jgi:hypothetical protein
MNAALTPTSNSEVKEYRVGGCALALLLGIGVPTFLLGPFLFGWVQSELISGKTLWSSVAFVVLGVWLAFASLFTDAKVVGKVMAPFSDSQVVVFFLPPILMLIEIVGAYFRRDDVAVVVVGCSLAFWLVFVGVCKLIAVGQRKKGLRLRRPFE